MIRLTLLLLSKYLLITLPLILFSCSQGIENKTVSNSNTALVNMKSDWENQGLKGTVLQLSVETYDAVWKDGIIIKGEPLYQIDDVILKFDSIGTITSSDWNVPDSMKNTGTPDKIELDEPGNIIKRTAFNNDGSEYFVDSREYNNSGLLSVEKREYSTHKPEHSISYFEYNRSGNIISHIRKDENGSLKFKESYSYDIHGNNVYYSQQYTGDELNEYSNKYNHQNKLIETIWEVDSELYQTKTYLRNKNQDIIKEESLTIHDQQNIFTYEYEYDNKENWTKRTWFDKKNNPVFIVVRKIVYFN